MSDLHLRIFSMRPQIFCPWAQPLGNLGAGGSGPPQNLDGPPTFYITFRRIELLCNRLHQTAVMQSVT